MDYGLSVRILRIYTDTDLPRAYGLREYSFGHVLDVGGDHRLFLGCPLSGYKDSMQGFSGLGVCVFASKAFGLWQRLLGVIYFLLMGSSYVKIIFGFL
jgi:hypothetical protein